MGRSSNQTLWITSLFNGGKALLRCVYARLRETPLSYWKAYKTHLMGTAAIVKTEAKSVKQSFLLCFHQSFVAQAPGMAG
jgi:membrane glycosyltransferase